MKSSSGQMVDFAIVQPIAFDRTQSSVSGDIAAPLRAYGGRSEGVNDGKADTQCVAFAQNTRDEVRLIGGDGSHVGALPAQPGMKQQTYIVGFGVRRLTPTEAERLQGFDDGWTAGQSDTQRYKQLGNAVCVNVAEWIGRRIVEVEAGAKGRHTDV